jgi:hypothetical protein
MKLPVTAALRERNVVVVNSHRATQADHTRATGCAVEPTVFAHPNYPGTYSDLDDQPNEHEVALHALVDVILPSFDTDGHAPGIVLRIGSAEAARRLAAALARAAELLASRTTLGALRDPSSEGDPWMPNWPTVRETF